MVDALAVGGEERRGSLRKAPGSWQQALIRGYLNGGTRPVYWASCTEYIGVLSEPRELKHLST